ncbi:MAG TPA: TM0106 family RecB-like putative nuclease [Nocardioides sp.]
MFLIDDALHWSASDLTSATECEYGALRRLDHLLGRAAAPAEEADPLLQHIARLGDAHEARLLTEARAAGGVVELAPVPAPYRLDALHGAAARTRAALEGDARVVYQATLFDGEFFGYADFVEHGPDGWVVEDAKLARSAKPRALVQLGAYADRIAALGVPVAPEVALLLGDGSRVTAPTREVVAVFREQRGRFRRLLETHRAQPAPVAWGATDLLACGRCAACAEAIDRHDDVLRVAGLGRVQRRRLAAAGITTVASLAGATTAPDGMAEATFTGLRAQAQLQAAQAAAGPDAPLAHELRDDAAQVLGLLPAPSPGDLFFDFEGDPLHTSTAGGPTGLEYLWGFLTPTGTYDAFWAHDAAAERAALEQFVDLVTELRATHPGMHVYHYAPYETTALKRLAMRYQTREDELDDLLRGEVFVDLYATVRGAVRVASPSYSIKKLEPLYMGSELRSDDEDAVGDGGASVVAYHRYRLAAEVGDEVEAARLLESLRDYNEYDCLSTLRLRDWLLAQAAQAGIATGRPLAAGDPEEGTSDERDPLAEQLLARSGPADPADRTPDEQAYALLAAAIDYHRRERKQFWWDHFERLGNLVTNWREARDVFVVESAEVISDWALHSAKAQKPRRTLRLVGDWTPGSRPATQPHVVYGLPHPPGGTGPVAAPHTAFEAQELARDERDDRVVLLTESAHPEAITDRLPVAITPARPPDARQLEDAIHALGTRAAVAPTLPTGAALDLLARRTPRLRSGGDLPATGDAIADVAAALRGMEDSYVAVQGPPGTGKSYTGARVIRALVEEGWKVGVVAQSHTVVEHLLDAVVAAGLDPTLVGKSKPRSPAPSWSVVGNTPAARATYVEKNEGCVLGGTAWTFAHPALTDTFDLLVVDEAGQFSLAPTIAASQAARRLLLLGDPQQLPQVSQGTHPEPVDTSALGWLMDGADTLPTGLGYFLADSHRMHPALTAHVSALSYAGRLRSAPAAATRDLAGVEPGLEVVRVSHTGNRTESPEEAAEVVRQVQRLLGTTWTDPSDDRGPRALAPPDFLVVAPYNAQVHLIQDHLDAAGLAGVRVGTVDRFQGQEAPVSILSTTTSSHADASRGMGFLLNRNRVNVAISRAQWRAIVVRSTALTSFLPSTVDGVLELGAFIALD